MTRWCPSSIHLLHARERDHNLLAEACIYPIIPKLICNKLIITNARTYVIDSIY